MKYKKNVIFISILLICILFFAGICYYIAQYGDALLGEDLTKETAEEYISLHIDDFYEIVNIVKACPNLHFKRSVLGGKLKNGDAISIQDKRKLNAFCKKYDFISVYVSDYIYGSQDLNYIHFLNENGWFDVEMGIIFIYSDNEEMIKKFMHLWGDENYERLEDHWYYYHLD